MSSGAYRDQNERVSAKLVEIPVEKFLAQVPEPSPQEIQSYLRSVQGRPPRPRRATPGFKIPRQIQVEILSIDGNALARGIKDRSERGRAPDRVREPQVGIPESTEPNCRRTSSPASRT